MTATQTTKLGRFWRIFRWLLLVGIFVAVAVIIFSIVYFLRATKDLPSIEALSEYRPPVMTRVHAGDGKLIAEYAKESRVFVPIETIPRQVQLAFVAAEDQRFYSHDGFDERGFARAMVANVGHKLRGERLEGGSTITQQVAKIFLVGSQRTIDRKLREVVIARRIEKAMDKDHILELYLNEIYFGRRAYGIAAASLNYFGKPMNDLDLADAAYLAVLPKAPNNYNPETKKERALARRNYVLNRMVEDGYATQAESEKAKAKDLVVTDRLSGEEYLAAEYFVEEARKNIFSMYGEDELYEGGLSIRTTLDTGLQLAGRRALRQGLEAYDKRSGYRGPLNRFENFDDWKKNLDDVKAPADISPWRVALVRRVSKTSADLEFQLLRDEEERLETGKLNLNGISWANGKSGKAPETMTDVLSVGDIILVEAIKDNTYDLRQVPEVNGGLIAMDPHTGRVLALVGGYSFAQSQFNRASQAYRQPGSSFKPFVYAAALQNGFTPSSQVLDAPFVIERQDIECEENEGGVLELRGVDEDGQLEPGEEDAEEDECERFYKPSNYTEGRFYGLSTLRLGLEKSRNAMTVRLANDIGMAPIMQIGRAFDIYNDPKPELAWALGAGETTLVRLATAYSMLVNGGKKVDARILDRVQNGAGKTVYLHEDLPCELCRVEEWDGLPPPDLPDNREVVIDPVTAYQVVYMMQGVIDNGTGSKVRGLGRPLGGKTGTTNDYLDAWFMGFSPDLVAGVYVGYDNPKTLNNEAGGVVAAPIFKDFMEFALKSESAAPFRIPEGVTLAPVNRDSGEPSYIGAPGFILEAFKPGTEPKIGELSQTIRVGSGRDTYFSVGDNFGNEDQGEPSDSIDDEDREAQSEDEGTDDGNASETDEEDSEAVLEDLPDVPETEEDELDDGLY